MNKLIFYFILISIAGCSFNENSKFWTESQVINEENNPNYEEILIQEEEYIKSKNILIMIMIFT